MPGRSEPTPVPVPDDGGSPAVAGPDRPEPKGWLLLTYRVPTEPSRLRATVWRRLKSGGAIYLQNSVAALPDTPIHERMLRSLRAEIGDLGGSAQLFRSVALAGGNEVVAAYNAARDDEYEEIVDKCQDFLSEIATETAAQHFTFGELEENDEELTKLRRWLAKIVERDVLSANGAAAAHTALDGCDGALAAFAQSVYRADTDGS
jgi:hypothetical protein